MALAIYEEDLFNEWYLRFNNYFKAANELLKNTEEVTDAKIGVVEAIGREEDTAYLALGIPVDPVEDSPSSGNTRMEREQYVAISALSGVEIVRRGKIKHFI